MVRPRLYLSTRPVRFRQSARGACVLPAPEVKARTPLLLSLIMPAALASRLIEPNPENYGPSLHRALFECHAVARTNTFNEAADTGAIPAPTIARGSMQ